MKKRIMCLSIALIFCLTSCSVIDELDEALEESNKLDRFDESEESEESNVLYEYEIEATEYAIGTDEEGQSFILINYKFTNNGDDANSFFGGITHHVYQNGVRLERAYGYESENEDTYIKSGASVDIEIAYQLIDTTSDVEIEFELGGSTIYYGEDADKKLTQTIRIADYQDSEET